MIKRRANRRGVKRHRNYTVDEAARAMAVAKGTVRRWLKNGLPAITDQKPLLILGEALGEFLDSRRATKQTCRLTECYCFSCRAPRESAGAMAELRLHSSTIGNLRALCCTCFSVMHKRVSITKLPELQADLDVTIKQAEPRL